MTPSDTNILHFTAITSSPPATVPKVRIVRPRTKKRRSIAAINASLSADPQLLQKAEANAMRLTGRKRF
jgi:hypothetical protein